MQLTKLVLNLTKKVKVVMEQVNFRITTNLAAQFAE